MHLRENLSKNMIYILHISILKLNLFSENIEINIVQLAVEHLLAPDLSRYNNISNYIKYSDFFSKSKKNRI